MVSFIKDENGQGMVEYALILALIAVVVIAAVTAFGQGVNNLYNSSANQLPNFGE